MKSLLGAAKNRVQSSNGDASSFGEEAFFDGIAWYFSGLASLHSDKAALLLRLFEKELITLFFVGISIV